LWFVLLNGFLAVCHFQQAFEYHNRKACCSNIILLFDKYHSKLGIILQEKVQAACLRLECSVAFDCKGGAFSPLLLNALPSGSHFYLYGDLEGDVGAGITARSLINQVIFSSCFGLSSICILTFVLTH
jgi:hypothetical protein